MLPTVVVIVPAAFIVGFVAKKIAWPVRRSLIVGATIITLLCGYVYVSQAVTTETSTPSTTTSGCGSSPMRT